MIIPVSQQKRVTDLENDDGNDDVNEKESSPPKKEQQQPADDDDFVDFEVVNEFKNDATLSSMSVKPVENPVIEEIL